MSKKITKKQLNNLYDILKNDSIYGSDEYNCKLLKNFLNDMYMENEYVYLDKLYLDVAWIKIDNIIIDGDELWCSYKEYIKNN